MGTTCMSTCVDPNKKNKKVPINPKHGTLISPSKEMMYDTLDLKTPTKKLRKMKKSNDTKNDIAKSHISATEEKPKMTKKSLKDNINNYDIVKSKESEQVNHGP
jgi:hypothetical protein